MLVGATSFANSQEIQSEFIDNHQSFGLVSDFVPAQDYLFGEVAEFLHLAAFLSGHEALDVVGFADVVGVELQSIEDLQDAFSQGDSGFEGFLVDGDLFEPAFELCESISFYELFADIDLNNASITFWRSRASSSIKLSFWQASFFFYCNSMSLS
jgi:hypothetical protein